MQCALKHRPQDLSHLTETRRLHRHIVTLNTKADVVVKATINSIFSVDCWVELFDRGRMVMLLPLNAVVSTVEAIGVLTFMRDIFGASFLEQKVKFLGFLVTGKVLLGVEVKNFLGLLVEVMTVEVVVMSADETEVVISADELEVVNILVRRDVLIWLQSDMTCTDSICL